MKVAFGLRAHSGWAALVVLGTDHDDDLHIVTRRRMELVENSDASWARQPYHAAEHLRPAAARALVERGLDSARRMAVRELQRVIAGMRETGHEPVACAVLTGSPMPDWTVDDILAVHFRMHKAEGVMFRDALARAAGACGLTPIAIPEKELEQRAGQMLAAPPARLRMTLARLGKAAGPPWGRDQKDAALAALAALRPATGGSLRSVRSRCPRDP